MTEHRTLRDRISRAWQAWRGTAYWTPEAQIRYMRNRVLEDHQWLGNSPLAAEMCERYLQMLAGDWYCRSHEDVRHFRERMGLDPHRVRHSRPSPLFDDTKPGVD